ncbi:MAG: ImmA/IrrE family metallo-endopeptidase [Pelagibacterium sp.]|uniref:ImmA/IrrE family metallo-endopeptidase n=1 Tax=Pelagibacterium sp. TaxID=1967288 RepID=UPI0032EAAA95
MKLTSEKLKIVNDFLDQEEAPVRVITLAHTLGLKVYRAPWPSDVSGKIQKDPARGGKSGYAIFVNQDHHENRRRFTIAHEIAHYVLHERKIGDGVFDDALYRSGLSDRAEVEANKLAADILMPRRLLRKYQLLFDDDAEVLAREFKVSEQAMKIRLGQYV